MALGRARASLLARQRTSSCTRARWKPAFLAGQKARFHWVLASSFRLTLLVAGDGVAKVEQETLACVDMGTGIVSRSTRAAGAPLGLHMPDASLTS